MIKSTQRTHSGHTWNSNVDVAGFRCELVVSSTPASVGEVATPKFATQHPRWTNSKLPSSLRATSAPGWFGHLGRAGRRSEDGSAEQRGCPIDVFAAQGSLNRSRRP